MQMDGNGRLVLPKNIRQMGTFGDTYKVYVEDFVYTYVHQSLHQRKKETAVLAAVLLGKAVSQDGQEYIFINGAQKVDFSFSGERAGACGQAWNGKEQLSADEKSGNGVSGHTEESRLSEIGAIPGQMENDLEKNDDAECLQTQNSNARTTALTGAQMSQAEQNANAMERRQEFWSRVYQRIKESFDDCDILGWYFNLDGSGLEVHADIQRFFEATYRKGSRFLYYEDSVEKADAFFVQEQHRLQRLSGYAVYYEKNPQMQEFMIAERERMTPKPLRDSYRKTDRDEVVENYRAIMNKLNEKPARKKLQPVVYVAGAAVLAVVAAMGVGQIGNYQNLKVLEQTLQTVSKAVGGSDGGLSAEEEVSTETGASGGSNADGAENGETATAQLPDETAAGLKDGSDGTTQSTASAGDNQESGGSSVSAGTASASSPSDYYIVQKGDSLASISRTLYGTIDKVQEICNLNSIENKDVIYEGQKLLLP